MNVITPKNTKHFHLDLIFQSCNSSRKFWFVKSRKSFARTTHETGECAMHRSLIALRASNVSEHSQGLARLVIGAGNGRDDPFFEGRAVWANIRGGLTVHCCDGTEMQSVDFECQYEPRLVFLLTEGKNQVRYGNETVDLRVAGGSHDVHGLAVASVEPIVFKGHFQPGRRVRRLVVNVGAEWLESSRLGSPDLVDEVSLLTSDMAACRWHPSTRLKATVAQMLSPPDFTPFVQRLYLESRALDVVAEAFASIVGRGGGAVLSLKPQEHRRIQRVMMLLNSGDADDWSLDRIAEDAGINVNSLQKQFRLVTGITIFEYQRGRRLTIARRALERDGCTVAQAASLAGYNSAANFATAFKRQFGMAPKHAKALI
ncbi:MULTISPECIES: helix-turn-helix transcriptional regulator [Pseudomonas fluorescens group]